MKLEHVALNVADPIAMAKWYVEHLGMKVVHSTDPPISAHFLADSSGTVMIEIYHNPPDAVPDYAGTDPLVLHLAFVSPDPGTDRDRLLGAGATFHKEEALADGGVVIMLRDPWGVPVQLCRRGKPLLRQV